MCVICVKEKGIKMPSEKEIRSMWEHNPDGAGYMLARDGKLWLSKGFMDLDELLFALDLEEVRKEEALVLHFRIATQGRIAPENCHPFPVSRSIADMSKLCAAPDVGIAHNGIITRCTYAKSRYSDTALFVTTYVASLVRSAEDLGNPAILEALEELAPANKFALMDGSGKIATIGHFEEVEGLKYSNLNHHNNYRRQWKYFRTIWR